MTARPLNRTMRRIDRKTAQLGRAAAALLLLLSTAAAAGTGIALADEPVAGFRVVTHRENSAGSLKMWNVVIMGRAEVDPDAGDLKLGLRRSVPCIVRSRFKTTKPANIKALTSRPDRVVDLERDSNAIGGMSDKELIELRNRVAPEHGLLLVYPISSRSTPQPGPGPRHS